MDRTRTNLLNKIIRDIDATYQQFLKVRELPDTPITKVGFFDTLSSIIDRDPIPDVEVQRDVLKYLKYSKYVAADDFVEQAEMMFIEITKTRELTLQN